MHTSFATTTRGVDRSLPPMHLNDKARGVSLDEINRVAREAEEV